MPRARSNSFNFIARGDYPRGAAEPCPIEVLAHDFDPQRSLFLRLRDRMRLFETRTQDFDDSAIGATRALGQLYADVSSKLFADDFERDLKKLRECAECAECSKRARCGRAWQPAADNVFTRAREELEAIVAGLSGSILDVGCGEGPYLRVLERGARAGRLAYTGLDPSAARIELLRSRHAFGRYVVGELGDLAAQRAIDAAPFDHVLFLRSYNHLADPARAIALAVDLLSPGGTLLVVDNVAFGLLREARHAARAEHGPGEFEHYRNDGIDAFEALAGGLRLRPLRRRGVSATSSHEWLAHYRKPEGAR